MWGFLSGTLILIVLQTLLQPGSADKVSGGFGAVSGILSRLLSGGVAGMPLTKTGKASKKASDTTNKYGLSAEDTGAATQPWMPSAIAPTPSPNTPGITTGPQDPTLGGILPR